MFDQCEQSTHIHLPSITIVETVYQCFNFPITLVGVLIFKETDDLKSRMHVLTNAVFLGSDTELPLFDGISVDSSAQAR